MKDLPAKIMQPFQMMTFYQKASPHPLSRDKKIFCLINQNALLEGFNLATSATTLPRLILPFRASLFFVFVFWIFFFFGFQAHI